MKNGQSKKKLVAENGYITLCSSDLNIKIPFSYKAIEEEYYNLGFADISIDINEVRFVPDLGYYTIEVVYTVDTGINFNLINSKFAALDLGLNNLGALVINGVNKAWIYNGKPLKSINTYYNQLIANAKSKLTLEQQVKTTKSLKRLKEISEETSKFRKKHKIKKKKVKGPNPGDRHVSLPARKTSNKIQSLWRRRENRINHYLHQVSKAIVKTLLENGVTTLAIGWNIGIKYESPYKNFVQVPYRTLISMIRYKASIYGINIIEVNESYTSVASALDLDPIQRGTIFSGSRVERGLYQSKSGCLLNADINAAINILRTVTVVQRDWILGLCSVPVVVQTPQK